MIITEEEAEALGIETMPAEMAEDEAQAQRSESETQVAPDVPMAKSVWNGATGPGGD